MEPESKRKEPKPMVDTGETLTADCGCLYMGTTNKVEYGHRLIKRCGAYAFEGFKMDHLKGLTGFSAEKALEIYENRTLRRRDA